MKNLLLVAAALVLGAAAWAHADAATPETKTGEVVDLSCYLSHQAKGHDHAKCAKTCLTKDHTPAGLLTDDGKLFALVADHKHMKVMPTVCSLGGEKVKLTGEVVETDGLQAILVANVQKEK